MNQQMLAQLLQRNDDHVETLSDTYFADVQDGQNPDVVSICCSDSRVSQEKMFSIQSPGTLFTPSNIGNQAWDTVDGDKVVDGNLLYPIAHTDTRTIAVVGHTSCGAITAAYQAVTDGIEEPKGIEKYVDLLTPVVEDALEHEIVDTDANDQTVINQLVEYNVDRQIAFLQNQDDIPDHVDLYGFVYDFQEVYGDRNGALYLVNVNGTRDVAAINEHIPGELDEHVDRLTTY